MCCSDSFKRIPAERLCYRGGRWFALCILLATPLCVEGTGLGPASKQITLLQWDPTPVVINYFGSTKLGDSNQPPYPTVTADLEIAPGQLGSVTILPFGESDLFFSFDPVTQITHLEWSSPDEIIQNQDNEYIGTYPFNVYLHSATMPPNPPDTAYQLHVTFRVCPPQDPGSGGGIIFCPGVIAYINTTVVTGLPPTVQTDPPTAVGTTTATLWGQIVDDGGRVILDDQGNVISDGYEPCQYRFMYKNQADGVDTYTPWTGSVTTGESISYTITGLVPGASYSYAAQAKNSNGDSSGNERSFKAPSDSPYVNYLEAQDIGSYTATFEARIIEHSDTACQCRFAYGTTEPILGLDGHYQLGPGWTCLDFEEADEHFGWIDEWEFFKDISGLAGCTTYYFGAQGRNAAGEEGPWELNPSYQFTTIVVQPATTTEAASEITATTAALNGTVTDDGGEACQYHFRYKKAGGDYSYSSYTGSVTTGQSFSEMIGGLDPASTYYFNSQARNSAGRSDWGNEQTFTTAAVRALATTSTAGGTISTPGIGAFQYDFGSVVNVSATPAAHYHFVNWTGTAATAGKVANPSSASTTVTMDADYSLQANFALDQHTLTTSTTAGGTVGTPGIGAFPYDHGSAVSVTAAADAHYHFVNWTGTAVDAGKVANSSSASTTVTMNADYTLQANFAINTYTLNVSATNGSVTQSPDQASYDHGTVVTLEATPEAGHHFVNWTGDASGSDPSTTVTMDGNKSVQANFAVDQHALTVRSSGNGAVSGSGTYDLGSTVPITATGNAHHHFVNWTADATVPVADTDSANTTATINGDGAVTARFAIDQQTLTVSSGGNGLATGSGTYDWGSTVPVTATADVHHHFSNWTGTAVSAGRVADPSSADTTVTVDADYTLVANFESDALYTLTISSTAGGNVTTPGLGAFQYDGGERVTLAAEAKPLFKFAGWTGSLFSQSNPTSVTIEGDCDIRAHFVSLLDTIYVDDNTASDPDANGTSECPFDSIQKAIEVARDGTEILVDSGVYHEQIDLMSKNIRVQGLWLSDPNVMEEPVVDGNGVGPIVTFSGGEDANCVLAGLRIEGGRAPHATAILCLGSPIIANCLIIGNRATDLHGAPIHCGNSSAVFINCTITANAADAQGALMVCVDSNVMLSNSILWGNTPSTVRTISGLAPAIVYCDVEGGWLGAGNLDVDPLFAEAGCWSDPGTPWYAYDDIWVSGDYHLRSQTGRWDPATGTWVVDTLTSPCIDRGDPACDCSDEPLPNGSRMNIGAYGGTIQASCSNLD